ncbi:MAG: YdcF family protein [Verrucomicrobia bacterium]|nr:YdcF family protein [Deltaproteobacteria bacterium]
MTVCLAAALIGVCLLGVMAFLGWRTVPSTAAPLARSAAIVLLAGSSEERSPTAASLYRAGYAPRIILTNDGVRKGWSREHQRNLYAIERTEIELVKLGVPRQAIVRLPFGKSGTVYDALAVKDYAAGERPAGIILVTSDYHARRALWVFQRVLRGLPLSISIVPARSHRPLLASIPLESIKLVYYLVRFGLVTDPAGGLL